jgi:hypothetical protein
MSWYWESEEKILKLAQEYDSTPIKESYRKISSLFIVGMVLITMLLAFFIDANSDAGQKLDLNIYNLIITSLIYLPLAYCVWRGYLWSMYTVLILWTFEKWIMIVDQVGSPVTQIIFWFILSNVLVGAIRVEYKKRKLNKEKS